MGSGSYNGRVGRHGPVFSLDELQLSSIKPKTGCLCAVDGAALSHEMLDQVAVAFVVKADPNQDDDELAAAIIAACKTNLADFKVPRAVYFVDDFPKATLDKVAKNELREMADAHPAV